MDYNIESKDDLIIKGNNAYNNGDYQTAGRYFLAAANRGNSIGEYLVGAFYHLGKSVKIDYGQAALWYRKSAEHGFRDAQRELGKLYKLGMGVPRDYQQAVYWLRQAAEQGDVAAQSQLGILLYEEGPSDIKTYQAAEYWFRKAAEQRDSIAQYNLAIIYCSGKLGYKDIEKARGLLEDSVAQGNDAALDALFELNRNFPKNKTGGILKKLYEIL